VLFNRTCTACHGVEGAAGDRGPAMFGNPRSLRRTDEDLFSAIDKGIEGSEMPPMGLKAEETHKIVAFIRSLRAKAIEVPPPGDVAKGADVFWGKGDCGRCHAVQGRGGLMGPDLSNAGSNLSLKQIRDALTVAKPHVPAGYRPVRVVTDDGQVFSGVSKNEHNFSLQMLADDNQLHLFTSNELKEVTYSDESLMPADFDKRLSSEEFDNLLAFLSRLSRAGRPGGEAGRPRQPID
jgi:putative heme-binding domain-containing protein